MHDHLSTYAEIGMALSGESDVNRLLEMIVYEARKITGADAGTLYMVGDDGSRLDFVILQNETMNTRMGGTTGVSINLPPVPLYVDGEPNHANVSSHVAVTGDIVNIDDVYESEEFDFTGPRKYDAATGYRSKSMLVIPMRNHENEIMGVLQLLNATDPTSPDGIGGFTDDRVMLVASLASQAAAALTKTQLIQDLKDLFYAFIKSIANAIEEKSPYTGGHINRVVDITMMIAEEINRLDEGPFKDVFFTEDEMEELKLAAWLHDVGKIITPEYVVDKSSKLETIFDRVHMVKARLDLIAKVMEADFMRRMLDLYESGSPDLAALDALHTERDEALAKLADDSAFVLSCNEPGEFMSDERIERLKGIAARTFTVDGETQTYLTDDELKNLCIRKGTLTGEERGIIENHARMTGKMLGELPFPKKLSRVPEYASAHHEKMDGTGYPLGLSGDELALQSRIMAVADIFEALTAKDRPYKKPMPLSQAVKILGFMKKDKHVDPNVHDLFLSSGLFREYAEHELNPDQFDEVVVNPCLTERRVLIASTAPEEGVEDILTGWGAQIERVADAAQAEGLLREAFEKGEPFKLAILDADLPEGGGFAVAEALVKVPGFPAWSLAVVASGHVPGNASLAVGLGLAGYLVAPVEVEELRKLVQCMEERAKRAAVAVHAKMCRLDEDDGASRRILVVDDSANSRMLVQYYLKGTPYEVEFAESGRRGVAAFGQTAYALVLMGSQLADMPGHAAIDAMRSMEREARLCATPFIALTPHYVADAGPESLRVGYNDFLAKPIAKQDLLAMVDRYMNR
ncbi:response regulator RpfG family c-di-GMP phosphodiesterase [Desulfobaculum xiamenense]|uniref:Response regulator RpfG family c-di-GMP phosphodiesterase n=1 Tax=Desulfobaculum xiamenense TaxID=995050 RepID=A0A846QHX5_9BACT|nr:HD domain-containing phosphohydrolase [Desulfobaculum xiamenense]NJB67858.1 response regulator RpfG family c-di-GMP phosphodiesterase [Desulfobaculum xiamenense]